MLRTLVAVFFWMAALFIFILSLSAELSAENERFGQVASRNPKAVAGKSHAIHLHPLRR